MEMYFIGLILFTTTCVGARTFNNPILSDEDYIHPKALKFNGTYYLVAETPGEGGKFSILTSTDLVEWTYAGPVFGPNNIPRWAGDLFYYPSIHQVGSNFVVYFSAYDSYIIGLAICVAIATHPLGPYRNIDRPIMSKSNNEDVVEPSIINDADKLYLTWSEGHSEILARDLNSNGLILSSKQPVSLLKPSLTWENGFVYSPRYLRRGNYHYIIYSGSLVCNNSSVGVARSSDAMGPYEKLPSPIIIPNSIYGCIRDATIVKDLNEENDVIFFSAYRNDDPDKVDSVLLASVSWSTTGWPQVGDF